MPKIEGYMFEEHDLVRASATECMCNLALSTEVRQTFTYYCRAQICLKGDVKALDVSSGAEAVSGHRERSFEAACTLQWRGGREVAESCCGNSGYADR